MVCVNMYVVSSTCRFYHIFCSAQPFSLGILMEKGGPSILMILLNALKKPLKWAEN